MARPLTVAQRRQHAAFLVQLARTGNVLAAARAIGMSDATLHYRRKRHPAFALRWDATLAAAHARLNRRGGAAGALAPDGSHRAAGGEATVVLRKDGRLQLRAARRDSLTRQCEQAFLLALAATANVSLSAAAAGASVASFNRRRRRNPAFAREMAAALAQGYERLEMALLEGWSPASGEDAAWRDNHPPALPPMTVTQALQLMYLHHKQVMWRGGAFDDRLLPGESSDLRSARLARLYRARLAADTEDELAAKVVGDAAARAGRHEPPPIVLPDLAQVTGWSAADPAKGGHGDAALFGGWRMEHMAAQTKGRRGPRRGK